jgi:hypothetical protein
MPAQSLTLDEFSERLRELAALKPRGMAISVNDAAAAAYARVLEYGSIAGQKPWPHPGKHTVTAVDPSSGAEVVVSAQAPQGFIRVQAPQFLSQLRNEITAPVNWLDADALGQRLDQAVKSAATAALEQIRSAAPRDSGRLARSLEIGQETVL